MNKADELFLEKVKKYLDKPDDWRFNGTKEIKINLKKGFYLAFRKILGETSLDPVKISFNLYRDDHWSPTYSIEVMYFPHQENPTTMEEFKRGYILFEKIQKKQLDKFIQEDIDIINAVM